MKMKRILLALTFALLILSASAQEEAKAAKRNAYRGDVYASAFVLPIVGGSYAFETTHGVALGRRENGFVGGGLKYTSYDFGNHNDADPSKSLPSLRFYTGYVRGKYVVPSKKMKVNLFLSGDVGLSLWKSYNLETCIARHCAGVYANGDLGMAIRLYKQLSLDLSVGMWGVLGECGSPYLKLGFTF
jgi:hypothetical protein